MNPSPRRLPAPAEPPTMSVIVDLSEPLEYFHHQLFSLRDASHGGTELEAQLAQTSAEELVQLAVEVVGNIICEGGYHHGIGYVDIAELRKFADIRESLYDDDGMTMAYQPSPTPTEQFHLSVFEDQTSRVLAGFYGIHAGVIDRTHVADITLWRALTRIILALAGAAVHAGMEHHINDTRLISYHISELRPYNNVPYTYVMTLSGP